MFEIFAKIGKGRIIFLALIILLLICWGVFIVLKNVIWKAPAEEVEEEEEAPTEQYTKINQYHYLYTPPSEEICRQKPTKEERQECLDELTTINIVTKTKNAKECLTIKTLEKRDYCLETLGRNLGSYKICLGISDPHLKHLCISAVLTNTKDVEACEILYKDEPFELQECKDQVMAFKIAESGKIEDIRECKELKTLEYPNLCLDDSIGIKFNNDCSKVPAEFKDYCDARRISFKSKTKDECEKIKLKDWRYYCLLKIEKGTAKAEADDSDNDNLDLSNELFMNLDPHNPDTDGDGLKDGDEWKIYGTNPADPDTDGDGLNDGDEIKYGTNPNKPDTDGDGVLDGKDENPLDNDQDKDGLSDDLETKIGTDPTNPDTDGDGMTDGEEWKRGLDPLEKGKVLADTDKDGLLDIDEFFYQTDRLKRDTDGDGISDKEEVDRLTNPLGKGDMDFDEDGLTDKEEEKYKTNPTSPDTDGDGINDGEEIRKGTDPLKAEG